MSKKKANSKSDLKKVLDRNRKKEEKIVAKIDMQMEAEEEVAIIDFDDYGASSSEDVQIETTSNSKPEQKEDGAKQVTHPLSEEEKEERRAYHRDMYYKYRELKKEQSV